MSQITYKQITINPNDVVNPAYNFSEIDTEKVAQAVTNLMSAATNLSTVDTLAANMISSLSNTLARAAGLDHQIFQQMNDREVSSFTEEELGKIVDLEAELSEYLESDSNEPVETSEIKDSK